MSPGKNEQSAMRKNAPAALALIMPRETLFGAGCLRHVGEAAAAMGTRAFLVTAPESPQSEELAERVCNELLRQRIAWKLTFRDYGREPTGSRQMDCRATRTTTRECEQADAQSPKGAAEPRVRCEEAMRALCRYVSVAPTGASY